MSWYRVTFPESESLDEIERAVEARFGGMCSVYRGESDGVVFVRPHKDVVDLVRKQLDIWVEEGYLLSFEEKA